MNGPYHFYSPNIRPLQKRKDLAAIANLVEMCFADTMDQDGRDYIKQLRWLAQGFSGWGGNPFERLALPIQGFLWEEDQMVVGNLTLIPFSSKGRKYYLIANVATHPAYRRRGIARKMTLTALDYARTHGASSAWLHVRDDNPGAIILYQTLGFEERLRRTLWHCDTYTEKDASSIPNGVTVGKRVSQDWNLQSAWLDKVYPPEVSWNLPLNKGRMEPGVLKSLQMWFSGDQMMHLAARMGNKLIGLVTWEPSRTYADTLWMATDPEWEENAVHALMPAVKKSLRRKRPLLVNYPANRAQAAFRNSGFDPHMTLIWMEEVFSSKGE